MADACKSLKSRLIPLKQKNGRNAPKNMHRYVNSNVLL